MNDRQPATTLSENERRLVWNKLHKFEVDIGMLKGLVQNPMLITQQDMTYWSNQVERLKADLSEIQQYMTWLYEARKDNPTAD